MKPPRTVIVIESTAILALVVALVLTAVLVAASLPVVAQEGERVPLTEEQITDELIAAGGELFAAGTCGSCHGRDGRGGHDGPDLGDDEWLHGDGLPEAIRATIVRGVPRAEIKDRSHRREMRPMGGLQLDEKQLDALAAYVWSLSRPR